MAASVLLGDAEQSPPRMSAPAERGGGSSGDAAVPRLMNCRGSSWLPSWSFFSGSTLSWRSQTVQQRIHQCALWLGRIH